MERSVHERKHEEESAPSAQIIDALAGGSVKMISTSGPEEDARTVYVGDVAVGTYHWREGAPFIQFNGALKVSADSLLAIIRKGERTFEKKEEPKRAIEDGLPLGGGASIPLAEEE